jgi:hypothetical protein
MMSTQSEKTLPAVPSASQASTSKTRKSGNMSSNSKRLTFKSDPSVHHRALAIEELESLSNLVEGFKKEIASYSHIEREYMQQLEDTLTKNEARGLDNNIRLQHTASQIRRLRCYKKEAIDELTATKMKIAQLGCRMERISNEEADAELNVRLYELQMLYGGIAEDSINYQKPRQKRLGSEQPTLHKRSLSDEFEMPREDAGRKRTNRKTARVRQGHKPGAENDKNFPSNDLANTDSATEENLAENVMTSQIDEVSSGDSSNDKLPEIVMTESSSDLPSMDAEQTSDTGKESDNSNNVMNNDVAINNDIRTLMTSIEEQSTPLPMPELDIDESLGEPGKKKSWNLFSLVKKKEVR